jgi:hypothetical protein
MARDAAAAAVTRIADGGALRIYAGVRPLTVDGAPTGPRLAELRLPSPAFAPPVDGVATAHHPSPETDAPNAGRAAWFRVVSADGFPVFDGTVGKEMLFDDPNISLGATVAVTTFTYQEPEGDG